MISGFPLPGIAITIAALILLAWLEFVLPNFIPLNTFAGTLSNVKILNDKTFDFTKWNKLNNKPESNLLPNFDYKINQFEDFFHGEILGGKKYLRDLSKGNQKKAGVVAALLGEPKVVILDEPFANLDPSTQIRLKQILKDLSNNNKTTILVSSHDIQDVTEVCERIVLLEKGKVIKDIVTKPKTLKELEAYFKG